MPIFRFQQNRMVYFALSAKYYMSYMVEMTKKYNFACKVPPSLSMNIDT